MAFLAGKFARINAPTALTGPFRWNVGFRRERLDLTNFESARSLTGVNVHSEGTTGILDTTYGIEMYMSDANVNTFFPDVPITVDLLLRKSVSLGYIAVYADILEFSPNTSVRDRAMGTVQCQAIGSVNPAI